MCRYLRIRPSGFYAWLKTPLSRRARDDIRQTELIRKPWENSGKVYGYRKLHDDLLDQGETCDAVRATRLAKYGGYQGPDRLQAPSRQFWRQIDRPSLSGCRRRSILAPCGRLVDVVPDDDWLGLAGITDGGMETKAEVHRHDPFGSGQPIHQSRVTNVPSAAQSGNRHEAARQ